MSFPKSHKHVSSAWGRFIKHSLAKKGFATSRKPQRSEGPFRLAIIGSGPAGFYTAYRVMSRLPEAQIDMYESLPVPFGLVRFGVAPDHPEVKNCQEKFEEVASSPNFRFLGNVSIGSAGHVPNHCIVQLESLKRHYNSILFAYGASEDKKLGIPGESTLKGIYSARQFVGWYNGLPDCTDLDPNLQCEEAVIIGHGNVALDVARILLEDIDVLKKTDITEHALAHLAQSRIKSVHVVGRRGPMQAAFTVKEVRELMKLSGVAFHAVNRSLIPGNVKDLPRTSRRLMEVILKGSSEQAGIAPKSWSLDSCLSPSAFISSDQDASIVAGTEFNVTKLVTPFDSTSSVAPTGVKKVLPSGVVFRSIGYKSVPLFGFSDSGIQFDEQRGIMKNDGLGRATRLVSQDLSNTVATQQIPGLYCTGWVKRGPTGVIASTMEDAFTSGDAIIQDWLSQASFLDFPHGQEVTGGWDALQEELGSTAAYAVTWDQWRKIDRAERERGKSKGKEREKFTRVEDMLAAVG